MDDLVKNRTAICKTTGRQVKILGPDDFEGYEYNKPRYGEWELIRYPDGLRVWSPIWALEVK